MKIYEMDIISMDLLYLRTMNDLNTGVFKIVKMC